VRGYEWSPDGTKLVLVLQDPKPEDLEKDKDKKEKMRKPKGIVLLQSFNGGCQGVVVR
jgi:hypothetical protein